VHCRPPQDASALGKGIFVIDLGGGGVVGDGAAADVAAAAIEAAFYDGDGDGDGGERRGADDDDARQRRVQLTSASAAVAATAGGGGIDLLDEVRCNAVGWSDGRFLWLLSPLQRPRTRGLRRGVSEPPLRCTKVMEVGRAVPHVCVRVARELAGEGDDDRASAANEITMAIGANGGRGGYLPTSAVRLTHQWR
jgi:hypothetical protein